MKDFSKIAAPLTRLTQKNVKFNWTDRCEKHFLLLKDLLTLAPVLTLPSGDEGYAVYCDASRVGLGCFSSRTGMCADAEWESDCLCFTTVEEARAELPYS